MTLNDNQNDEKPVFITLGVCAMAKKTKSKPMKEILRRLEKFQHIKVIVFEEKVILKHPIEVWPLCDALISFYSDEDIGNYHSFPNSASNYCRSLKRGGRCPLCCLDDAFLCRYYSSLPFVLLGLSIGMGLDRGLDWLIFGSIYAFFDFFCPLSRRSLVENRNLEVLCVI